MNTLITIFYEESYSKRTQRISRFKNDEITILMHSLVCTRITNLNYLDENLLNQKNACKSIRVYEFQ